MSNLKKNTKNYSVNPTERHKKAYKKMVENGGNKAMALRGAGYSNAVVNTPQKVTKSKGWQELLEKNLPDKLLASKHKALLKSTRVEHMVFPLGPKGEDDLNLSGAKPDKDKGKDEQIVAERITLTDEEIIKMLRQVNCKVKRIVHGETARHVYFWSTDNMALKNALELAYKIKGRMKEGEKAPSTLNWYQIIYGNNEREPKKQSVEVVEPVQDHQQEGETRNIPEKSSAATVQRRKGTKKSDTQVTPTWIYD